MLAHFVNNLLTVLLIALLLYLAGGRALSDFSALPLWTATALAVIATQFPFYLLAGALLVRTGDWERRVIREGLADEIGGAVTAPEFALVQADHRFGTRAIPGLAGAPARALVNAQNELAFRKWRVRAVGEAVEADPAVAAWRAEITRLRGGSPATPAAPTAWEAGG